MHDVPRSAITIRNVRSDDLAILRDVLVTTWHATYDATLGRALVDEIGSTWHAIERLERQLATEGAVFLLAETADRIVATAFARPSRDGVVEVAQLYVLPQWQGHGIGRRLLERTLAAFPGAERASLEVEPRNLAAIAFYERAGFRVTGSGEDCAGCGALIRHLVMEKQLTPAVSGSLRPA